MARGKRGRPSVNRKRGPEESLTNTYASRRARRDFNADRFGLSDQTGQRNTQPAPNSATTTESSIATQDESSSLAPTRVTGILLGQPPALSTVTTAVVDQPAVVVQDMQPQQPAAGLLTTGSTHDDVAQQQSAKGPRTRMVKPCASCGVKHYKKTPCRLQTTVDQLAIDQPVIASSSPPEPPVQHH